MPKVVAMEMHCMRQQPEAMRRWCGLLVTAGADVNAQGGEYGNALCAASAEGHETVVRLLLENGTDINAQVERTGNALRVASAGRSREGGAAVTRKGCRYQRSGYSLRNTSRGMTAVHLAALSGSSSLVYRLLHCGGANWSFTPLRAWAMIFSFCQRDNKSNNNNRQTISKFFDNVFLGLRLSLAVTFSLIR